MKLARFALLSALALSACANDREVVLQAPLSRMEFPEPPPRMLAIGVGSMSTIQAQLTEDQTTTSPDPEHPKLKKESAGALRFDWLVAPRLELSLRNWGNELSGGQGKLYLLQANAESPVSMAVTLGAGTAKSEFVNSFDDARTSVKQSLTDFALIVGARTGRNLLVFGGPYSSRTTYKGHYFSARGSDPDVEEDFNGAIRVLGLNLGLAYTPRNWFTVAGEVSSARVKAGLVSQSPVTATLGVQFSFGRRTAPPEREERPIEVVPVGEEPVEEVVPAR